MHTPARACLAALLLLAFGTGSALAQESSPRAGTPNQSGEIDRLADQAAELYQSRDFEGAAAVYEKLAALAPTEPLYPFVLAKCRTRTNRPADALELIEKSVRMGLKLEVVHFERGRALFVAGRYPEAIAAYEEYHRLVPGDPFSRIAHAEALLAAERYQDALDMLEKVEQTPESRVRLEILTAAALTGLDRGEEAVSRLEGALGQVSDSERVNISGTIDLIRAPARAAGAPGKPWWINLTAGVEYDTNVPTAGKVKPRAEDFEGDLDAWRAAPSIDGGYRWQATDRLAVTGRFFSLLHANERLSERDIFLYRFSATAEYRVLDQVTAGLDGAYSHLWLDQEQLNNAFSAGAFVVWREAEWTASRLSFTERWDTFYDDEVNVTEDLDGTTDTLQFAQDFILPDTTLALRLAYSHENSHTDGSDFDYDSDAWLASLSYILPWELRAGVSYQHVHTTYHHPNFRDGFQDRRVNNTQIYQASLSREIVPGLDATLYYTLTDAESNVKDFDFDRNVYGFSLTYRF